MRQRARRSLGVFAALGLLVGGTAAMAATAGITGPSVADNTIPQGWKIKPAGHQVDVFRFPLGLTPTPDQSHVIVTSDNGGTQGLSVIDTATLSATTTPAANLFMGVSALPDGRIYASGGNANRVFRFRLAGPAAVNQDATEAEPFPTHTALDGVIGRGPSPNATLPITDGIRVNGYPGNTVFDNASGLLYVAGTLSEPSGTTPADTCPNGQQVCGRVSIVDTANDTVVGRAPVGMDAYGLALDPVRKRLYVSNWADESGRGTSGGGTVSVVDVSNPAAPHELGFARVGHQPSAVQLSADRRTLFVANTNDDTLSVLDVRPAGAPRVVTTESVRPIDGVEVGAHPDAFALSPDGSTLYLALAGLNAVEVRDGHTGARVAGHPMYIPTGWYPSALAITGTASKYRLWVANAKGIGPGPGPNGSVFGNGTNTNGTVSAIDLPVSTTVANLWTATVGRNDQFDRAFVQPCQPGAAIRRSQVLCPPAGRKSPIKHVLYIVAENKTFDQYFGDVDATKWDADPSWQLYGRNVTPNQHALAENGFGTLNDRFFSDAEVSVTGHSWTSGAIATDHNEKTWPADYDQGLRSSHGGGDPLRPSVGDKPAKAIADADDELNDPEGGYIFEAFKRAGATPPSDSAAPGGLSMAIYGEHTARSSGNMDAYKAPSWKDGDIQYFDTCRATQFVTGSSPQGPSPDGNPLLADCEGRTLPGRFNLAHWNNVFQTTGRDVMPNFMYMSLPDNHTLGTNLGSPTPASMVADNDYAIGLIVDALSHSPFWSSTAVIITQDDTQAAGDHVSALRDTFQVISPWAVPGPSHQWGSMPSLLRTIEVLFGVSPLSLNDRLAMPQHEAFLARLADGPHLEKYTAVRPAVPFALNAAGAPGQAESASMDFTTVDRIDEQLLNAILYADARGTPLDTSGAGR